MLVTILGFLCLFRLASTQKCDKDFDIRLNKILTLDSDNLVATFIHKFYADTLEECVKVCCDINDCTVGVFGPKVPSIMQLLAQMLLITICLFLLIIFQRGGTCFLFNCHEPSACNFTTETGYTVFLQRSLQSNGLKVDKVESRPSGTLTVHRSTLFFF